MGVLGVTGERDSLASTASVIAKRLKALTDKPVLVGIGVSNTEQAVEACEEADGVIVGSAIVRLVEQHASSAELLARVGDFIAGLKGPLRGGD